MNTLQAALGTIVAVCVVGLVVLALTDAWRSRRDR